MELPLNCDEIRIVASAISWTLHLEFHRSQRPAFLVSEIQLLSSVHDQLCFALHNNREVRLNESQLRIDPEAPFDREVVQNVIRCVRAFDAEIGHSPNEVKVVTDVPISVLKSLLGDLELFGND